MVLLVAAITFFAAVINSIRGNFEYTHWIFPVVAIGMGVGLYFGAERMANRPEHAIEVPADLSAVLNDLTIARGEVIATAPRVLNPDELQQVLTDAQERHKAAFAAASETLRAIRAGDIERASALGTEVYRHTDVIEQIRDDLQREWESSAEVPEGYIGDTDDDPPLGAPSPRSPMSRRAQAAEPAYPTSYPAEPIPPSRVGDVPPAAASGQPPPAEATRDFWSRPTSPPRGRAAGVYPRPEGGIGQSGSSTGPAE
ncbi:MAG: hypothetical protein ACRDTD_30340 [Pseudonocardiaceae bacterium]